MPLHVGYWLLVTVLAFTCFSQLAICKKEGVPCRCGLSRTLFQAPRTSVKNEDVCQKYRFCGSCKNGVPKCVSCPIGRTGTFCQKDIKSNLPRMPNKNRQARRRRQISRPNERIRICSDPGFIPDGERWNMDGKPSLSQTFEQGSSVVFSCIEGYTLHGTSWMTCQISGIWTNPLPVCKRVYVSTVKKGTCADPGFIRNGQRWKMDGKLSSVEQRFELGETVQFSCLEGHSLQGTSVIICQPSGRWSNRLPECKRVFTRTTTVKPSERKRTCPDPGFIQNGQRWHMDGTLSTREKSFDRDETAAYSCLEGYSLQGTSVIICQPSGRWSNRLPECKRVLPNTVTQNERKRTCPDPGFIRNGQRWHMDGTLSTTEKSFDLEETAAYSCLEGYSLQGTSVIICQPSGRWSNRLPECKRVLPNTVTQNERKRTCPDPGFIQNGQRWHMDGTLSTREKSFDQDETAAYSCLEGYSLQGTSVIICQPSGRWSNRLPECKRVLPNTVTQTERKRTCPDPGFIRNGQRWNMDGTLSTREKSFDLEETAAYSCLEGYSLQGTSVIICQPSGRWSSRLPECKRAFPYAGYEP